MIPQEPARVLIVDDERSNRQLLEIMLAPEGYVVLTAASGEEALTCVATRHPDLILLDVMMPGMDGYQVAAAIKADLGTKNIPVIMVTALDDRHARLMGLSAGAEEFLSKPVDRTELCVRVRNLLRLKAVSDFYDSYSQILEGEVSTQTARLIASERLYRETFDEAPVGIIHADLDGNWLRVNRRFCEMLGYSREELQVPGARELVLDEGALNGPTGAECSAVQEKRFRRRDGSTIWTRVNISLHKEVLDKSAYYILVIENVTEVQRMERELAASRDKFEHIFVNMADGYVLLDLEGNVQLVNPMAVQMFRFPDAAAMLGVNTMLLYVDPADAVRDIDDLARDGRIVGRTARLYRADGTIQVLQSNLRLLRNADGEPECVEIIFNDADERVLERQAREAADQASRMKSQFLANMSHEIRTPLNAILGMAHLALQTDLSGRQREYIEKMRSGGQSLLRIVNDILDFSKADAGKIELERLDMALDDVLESLVTTLSPVAREKGLALLLRVAPDVPARLLGDPSRLGQILLNLVGNALKFTQAGEVILSVDLVSRDEKGVRVGFEVADTGPGLTERQIGGLFVAFAQADSSITRQFGGTGLGLAICQQLVDLMQGAMMVRSGGPGQGSSFSFTALFGACHGTPDSPSLQLVVDVTALVIDGNPTARQILATGLESMSIPVTELDSLASALELLERTRPAFQLVLVDAGTPGGLEAVAEIRGSRRPEVRDALIVALADHGDDEIRDRALRATANCVLFRPYTRSHLFDTIMGLLGGKAPKPRLPQRLSVEQMRESMAEVSGARILVVEDNLINQQVARELLESVGLKVDVVGDGQQALETLASSPDPCPWDLVLMDLQMPVIDGYTATAAIRALERFHALPILAMTAHVLPEERERCYQAGMDDYISKPIDPETMFATLRRWLPFREQAVVAPSFPPIAGVDTTGALLRVAGNARLYRELLSGLANGREETGRELRSALEQPDPTLARILLHTFKGSTGNLGLNAIAKQAAQLESELYLPAGDLATREARLGDLSAMLESLACVSVSILEALKSTTSTSLPSGSLKQARAAAEHLMDLLVKSDGTARAYFPEFQAAVAERLQPPELDRLARLLREYDLVAAQQELRTLTLGWEPAAP